LNLAVGSGIDIGQLLGVGNVKSRWAELY